MWTIQKNEAFDRQFKWYEKKRPNEFSAVLYPLKVFFDGFKSGAPFRN